jgi:predicted GNAT family N-acyltransferase
MQIAELSKEDWKQYLELRFQLGSYSGSITEEEFLIKYESIKKQGGIIYVIKVGSKLVATAKLLVEIKFFDSVGHIEDVVVDINHRGFGYGKIIVKHMLNICDSMNCYKCVLDANKDLESFYTKCGMIKTGFHFTYTRK